MYPPIEELIAHRGSMLLVDRVLESSRDSIRLEANIRADMSFVRPDGKMPAWIGIEMMAQAIAAFVGLASRQRGSVPQMGLLLGTRRYAASVPEFPVGRLLVVAAREVYRDAEGLAGFDATIELDGVVIAEATLKVAEPADFRSFLAETG